MKDEPKMLELLYGPVFAEEIAMARLPYVEMNDAPPEVREIYETALRGKPGSVQKLLAHRPEVLRTFLAFYGTVGRTLDRRLYEMVYIRISSINQCHYCLQHHLASSKRVGLTPTEWLALKNGDNSSFTPGEQAALRFAEKLTRESHNIGDADVDALKPHFPPEQIVDLDMLVGLANLTNRLTDPLGADLETPEEKI
jgi:uncharacterized peroxidase-related enzyme